LERKLLAIWVGLFTFLCLLVASPNPVWAGAEFPICTHAGDQQWPAVSGNIVVWEDNRNGNWDIYGYDLSNQTEFPICTDAADQRWPQISGNTVVWFDDPNGNSNLYGYNLSTHTEFPICTNPAYKSWMAISGNVVVWTDWRNTSEDPNSWDIYGYNITTKQEFPICTAPGAQALPSISGDVVIWGDARNDPNAFYCCSDDVIKSIYGYRISTQSEFLIAAEAGGFPYPQISGSTVVWQENDSTVTYGYDLDSETKFPISIPVGASAGTRAVNVVISGDRIVWCNSGGDHGLSGYDLTNGVQFTVCTNPGVGPVGALDGNTVVWMDDRNGNSDIYGRVLANYHLSVAADPNTAGVVTGSGNYTEDSTVPISAVANPGWRFVAWVGPVADPNAAETTLTLNLNMAITAAFNPIPHTITVTAAADPNSFAFDGTTQLSASATDSWGHNITSWSWSDNGVGGTFSDPHAQNPTWTSPGNPSLTPASWHLTVTATCDGSPSVNNFANAYITVAPGLVQLTANISPAGSGYVSGDGTHTMGQEVTLTAFPLSGYWFTNWSGDVTGNANPTIVTMNANKSFTANFTSTPPPPTDLTATPLSSAQIQLQWTFAGNVSGFKIYRKTGAGAWGASPVATVTNLVRIWTDNNVVAATNYTYRVVAYTVTATSAYSNEASATTMIYVAPPASLVAKAASSSQVNLTWADKSNNETGFSIERRLGTTGAWSVIGTADPNTPRYTDNTVAASTLYNYRVQAVSGEATSDYSNIASVTTPIFVAAPTEVTATALSSSQIQLTWSYTGTVSGFKIYRRTGTGAWGASPVVTAGNTVRAGINSGLLSATTYTYRICAYTSTATSAFSDEASATTMIFVAAPTTLVAKAANARQVNLTWVDKSTNETGFSIERRLGTTGSWAEVGTVGAGIKAYTDTTTDPNTSYGYRVRAIAVGAASIYSNIASVKTPIYIAAPTDLVATSASATSIALSWTDNATNETGYKIERRLSTGTTWTVIKTTLANVTSFTNTGLVTGRTYIYRVRAYRSTAYSSYSNEATATVGTP
jgi:beta propeller repeat protein